MKYLQTRERCELLLIEEIGSLCSQVLSKTFGCTFLPLINSFEFLQILGIYGIKRITMNQIEFLRGKNLLPKVSKIIDS